MIFLQDCYLFVNETLHKEFCINQEKGIIKLYTNKEQVCLKLSNLYPDIKNSSNLIWKFGCKKCNQEIHFMNLEKSTQIQRENNLQKLIDNGLNLVQHDSCQFNESSFNLNSTKNSSQLFLFDVSKNNTNTNSSVIKQRMRAFSSLRFHPEEELIKKNSEDNESSSLDREKVEEQSCFQDDDLDLSQVFSLKAQNSIQKYKKRNTLTRILDIFKFSQQNQTQQFRQNEVPECVKNISSYFKINNIICPQTINICKDYDQILSNQIYFEEEQQSSFQKVSSIKFITQSSQSKQVFTLKSNQNENSQNYFENLSEVELQETTIQAILKYNQAIAIQSITNYNKKNMNQLYQDFNNNEIIKRFRFCSDMNFLQEQFWQWNFSDEINEKIFQKFWLIYLQAQDSLKELILQYFSFKNKKLIVNKFFVFAIKIFVKEIQNQIKSFDAFIKKFLNFSNEEILLQEKINTRMLECIQKQNNIEIDLKLLQNYQDIQSFIQQIQNFVYTDLNYIQQQLKTELQKL